MQSRNRVQPYVFEMDYVGINGILGCCKVAFCCNLAVCYEMPTNNGPSITNAIEIIAQRICNVFHISLMDLQLFELYDTHGYELTRVHITEDLKVNWTPVNVDAFQEMYFSFDVFE